MARKRPPAPFFSHFYDERRARLAFLTMACWLQRRTLSRLLPGTHAVMQVDQNSIVRHIERSFTTFVSKKTRRCNKLQAARNDYILYLLKYKDMLRSREDTSGCDAKLFRKLKRVYRAERKALHAHLALHGAQLLYARMTS